MDAKVKNVNSIPFVRVINHLEVIAFARNTVTIKMINQYAVQMALHIKTNVNYV